MGEIGKRNEFPGGLWELSGGLDLSEGTFKGRDLGKCPGLLWYFFS